MGTDARTARNPHTPRHGGVPANVDVVANLNQVVELDAIFNDGVLQSTSVDAGIGTNFNIIANGNSAQLFNFFPSTLVQRKPKTISADDHTCMNNATLTNFAVFAQRHPGFKLRVRTHPSTPLHHTQRTNDGRLVNGSGWVDDSTGVNSQGCDWR